MITGLMQIWCYSTDIYKTFNAALPQGLKNQTVQLEKSVLTFDSVRDYFLITPELINTLKLKGENHQYVVEYEIKRARSKRNSIAKSYCVVVASARQG